MVAMPISSLMIAASSADASSVEGAISFRDRARFTKDIPGLAERKITPSRIRLPECKHCVMFVIWAFIHSLSTQIRIDRRAHVSEVDYVLQRARVRHLCR